MRILIAAEALGTIGGAESYALTVAEHLERLGHDVWLWALEHGEAADRARERALRVLEAGEAPDEEPDAVLAQDAVASLAAAESHPRSPQVFVAHSDYYDKFLPPQVPGVVAAVVAMYDRVERRVRAMAVRAEVARMTQPIDTARFRPLRTLPDRPRRGLALGHYHFGERLERLRRACSAAGVELSHVGMHGASERRPIELVYNDADVVFGKGRVVHEAMACGRAAYVYDYNGGDGWVTRESYPELVADNFGGQTAARVLDEGQLAADIAGFDPGMGLVNRDLAVRHHAATDHAAALVDLLGRLAPRSPTVDAPLDELARSIRVMHRAQAWAALHERELGRLADAEQRETGVATHMARHADDLTERLHAAEDRARAAEEALAEVREPRRGRPVRRALRRLGRARIGARGSKA
jgi:hypothetical protein